ncbi:hypothetical protein FACS1894184_12090 [Clostridia bacterium]|nr:hypothetical protein FACS1894184_12090 [Clostridia bacterium]
MKSILARTLVLAIALVMLVSISLPASGMAARGFADDPDAIDKAAQSVLILLIFDDYGELAGSGSGFVAFDSSIVVTAGHVAESASSIYGIDESGKIYKFDKVYATDSEHDVALIGFGSISELEPLPVAKESKPLRADRVVSISSPLGLLNSVSVGHVSQLNGGADGFIQFTAPISSGSSGGALFNDDGEVIGIPTGAYIADPFGFTIVENLNFAVPIKYAIELYEDLDEEDYESLGEDSEMMVQSYDFYTLAHTLLESNIQPTPEPTPTPVAKPDSKPKPTPVNDDVLLVTDIAAYPFEDDLQVFLEVWNRADGKTVKSFDLSIYATDEDDKRIDEDEKDYKGTTAKSISPGKSDWSECITIPDASDAVYIHAIVENVTYTDGTSGGKGHNIRLTIDD